MTFCSSLHTAISVPSTGFDARSNVAAQHAEERALSTALAYRSFGSVIAATAVMETFFMLSPGIDRQVAVAGDLRKNLRLLEVDDAVLNEIVTRGCPYRPASTCLPIPAPTRRA